MHSHLDALQAMTPVGLRRLARDFHSVAKQASFYMASELIFKDFGRFGAANLEWKIDFGGFFSIFFSRSMLASIFNRFSEARNVKNSNFASTGAQFS